MATTAMVNPINARSERPAAAVRRSADVERDVDALLWSTQLSGVRRFYKQPYWKREGKRSDWALRLQSGLPLENVAEHSWKVADAAMLLSDRFPELDRGRCVELAIVHDKLELLTGDFSPIDKDATGHSTHAFNSMAAARKSTAERDALEDYLKMLRPSQRGFQEELYIDVIDIVSNEAKFVCALDKLAALIYVLQKKPQGLLKKHYDFTVAYSAKSVDYFPGLEHHYAALIRRLSCKEPTGLRWLVPLRRRSHDQERGALRSFWKRKEYRGEVAA